jgi:hypothetical protein
MSQSRANPFDLLNDAELNALKELESIISSQDKSRLAKATSSLSKYSPILIYKLAKNSNIIDSFCRSEPALHEAWAKFLKDKGFVNTVVFSMDGDGKSTRDIFDLYRGVGLYTTFMKLRREDEGRMEVLNMGCELGSYDCLVRRCQMNMKTATSNTTTEDKRQNAFDAMIYDLNIITNLYWAAGYIQAGLILKDISVRFYAQSLSDKNENRLEAAATTLNEAKSYRENAFMNFSRASELKDNAYSTLILDMIIPKGALEFEGKVVSVKDWDPIKSYYRALLKDRYNVLEVAAKEEITTREKAFEASHQSDSEENDFDDLAETTKLLSARMSDLLQKVRISEAASLSTAANPIKSDVANSTAATSSVIYSTRK